jgi:hypothetical protein
MAVTGTNTFSVTRNDIIDAALRVLGVIGIGETPQTEDYTNCSQALNIMIKGWAKKGWPLWTVQDLVIPMVEGVRIYPIGPTAGYVYEVTSTGGTGYTAGTWTAVGGTTGTAASGTYTVVAGAPAVFTITVPGTAYTTAPTSFTLSGAGTGATITGVIVGLTTNKPLRAFSAYIRDTNDNDTTLLPISKQEYDQQGYKFNQSVPNQFYYDNQLANANLYVYALPQDSTSDIYLAVERMFYDMTTGTDTFDFPQEWYQPLKWGLAAEVAVEYGIDIQLVPYYEQKASFYLEESFNFSVEESSVYFGMDYRGGH